MVYVFCLVYSPSSSLASSASSAEVDWFAPSSINWLSASFKASNAVAVFYSAMLLELHLVILQLLKISTCQISCSCITCLICCILLPPGLRVFLPPVIEIGCSWNSNGKYLFFFIYNMICLFVIHNDKLRRYLCELNVSSEQ